MRRPHLAALFFAPLLFSTVAIVAQKSPELDTELSALDRQAERWQELGER